jgi:uncharacterized membrane protein
MNEANVVSDAERRAAAITAVVYGLQAAALISGITLLIAVVINYVKRDDLRGTWLESHCRWQLRTFWFMLLWIALGAILLAFFVGFIVLTAALVWYIYRIAKGWLDLIERKPMYRQP